MTTLPENPLPVFADGDSEATLLTKMNALGYAVQFWTDCDILPTWHYYKIATQALTSGVWQAVNFGTVAFDSDSTFTTGGYATIQTAGIYAVETCVQCEAGTSGIGFLCAFLMTAGSNNPNQAAGTTSRFAFRGGYMPTSGGDGAVCSAGLTPWVMYPGDQIAVQVYPTANVTLDNNNNSTYENGRFVCNFTGQLKTIP